MVVSPRLTSFMSGETVELTETWVKPAAVASSATRRSMVGYLITRTPLGLREGSVWGYANLLEPMVKRMK